jgi:tetratricopeptide (TPR) repeat protein
VPVRLSDLFSKKDTQDAGSATPQKPAPREEPGANKAARAALLWKQGAKLMAKRKYPQAVASLREAFELEPSRLEGRLNFGAALYMAHHYDEALTHLNYVLAFEPQNAMALLNLAACLDAMGRLDESITTLERLVADRPTWRDAHYNLAVAYYKNRRYEEAETALKTELKINPQHEAARTLLNKVYLMPKSRQPLDTSETLPEPDAPAPASDSAPDTTL